MKINDFIKGYVLIEVKGNFCERFLNLAVNKGIKIKDINKVNSEKVYMCISVKDFLKIKTVAKLSACKVVVRKKEGLALKSKKYKKRNGLVVGIATCCITVLLLSNCILSVEITGNQKVSTEQVKMTLKNHGVKIFGSNKIKGKEVASKLLSEYPEISWAGVNIKGNKALVKIVEKSEIPEVYNPEQKYNLVADADGVITTYYLKKGFPVVSKGDTVKKGQLLVSGVTDSSVKNIRYINPEADINIVTWITEKSEANLVQIKDNYTNRVVKDTFIEINGKRYGIVRKVPFKYYNIKTTEKTVIPFIKLIKVNKMENVPQKIVYKDKELFEIERKKLYNKIVNGLKQEYRVIDTKYEYTSDGVKLYTTVTCVIEGPYVKKITADN